MNSQFAEGLERTIEQFRRAAPRRAATSKNTPIEEVQIVVLTILGGRPRKRFRGLLWEDEGREEMTQVSGSFPALYDNVKKTKPKPPRKPKK